MALVATSGFKTRMFLGTESSSNADTAYRMRLTFAGPSREISSPSLACLEWFPESAGFENPAM